MRSRAGSSSARTARTSAARARRTTRRIGCSSRSRTTTAVRTITAPLALEPVDVAAVGHDFAPDSFVFGVVRRGASLVSREGDFGFSKENGEPAAGHDIELVNFSREGERFRLEQSRFAFNCK